MQATTRTAMRFAQRAPTPGPDELRGHGDLPHARAPGSVGSGWRALFPDAAIYAMANEAAELGDKVHIDHPLHDGDAVDVGTLHVEAFATPGHTAGSAVYFTNGVLFFGDSAGGNKDGIR